MTLKEILFSLLRAELFGAPLPTEIKESLDGEQLEKLYRITKSQDLAHLLGDVLLRENLLSDYKELQQKFIVERRMAFYRREQLNYELKNVCEILESVGVEYLPLKGSILQSYYPEPWMRTSCDIDVLIRQEDVERSVKSLCENGFKVEGDDYHDMSLYSMSNMHLELHYELIEERDSLVIHTRLSDIWSKVLPMENTAYGRTMSNELFLFYHVAHMAKHFVYGGCGIRPFLDLWIMESKLDYNREVLQGLLQEGGIYRFYEYALRLSSHWFAGETVDETSVEMENYLLRGGVYGSTENKISVNRDKPKNKFAYVLSCVFLSYGNLKLIYPSLERHKWLFPFYQVRRWFRIIFKGVSKNAKHTLKSYDEVTDEQRDRVKALLKTLEL